LRIIIYLILLFVD